MVAVVLHMQVSNDECGNYKYADELRPSAAEDPSSSDSLLLHHPTETADLCRQLGDCSLSDSLVEYAGDSRDASTATVLESASLSSYNALVPRLSSETVTPSNTVQLWHLMAEQQTFQHFSVWTDCLRMPLRALGAVVFVRIGPIHFLAGYRKSQG